jgi:hypothetical protein
MILMSATNDANSAEIRRKKNTVGIIAITLLLLFTILTLTGIITPFDWIIADLIVAVIANLILKSIGKTSAKPQ